MSPNVFVPKERFEEALNKLDGNDQIAVLDYILGEVTDAKGLNFYKMLGAAIVGLILGWWLL